MVDNQFELTRLHHGQVRRLRALENATSIGTDLTKRIRHGRAITHQPAGLDKFSKPIRCGDRVPRREVDQLNTSTYEKGVGVDEKHIRPLAHKGIESCIDLAACTGLED